jgi:hypothetical protein
MLDDRGRGAGGAARGGDGSDALGWDGGRAQQQLGGAPPLGNGGHGHGTHDSRAEEGKDMHEGGGVGSALWPLQNTRGSSSGVWSARWGRYRCMEATSWTPVSHYGISPNTWWVMVCLGWDAFLGPRWVKLDLGPKSKVATHIILYKFH